MPFLRLFWSTSAVCTSWPGNRRYLTTGRLISIPYLGPKRRPGQSRSTRSIRVPGRRSISRQCAGHSITAKVTRRPARKDAAGSARALYRGTVDGSTGTGQRAAGKGLAPDNREQGKSAFPKTLVPKPIPVARRLLPAPWCGELHSVILPFFSSSCRASSLFISIFSGLSRASRTDLF